MSRAAWTKEVFFAPPYVIGTENSDDCWIWTWVMAKSHGSGKLRGHTSLRGKQHSASNVAYRLWHGDYIPAGLEVCHTCDVNLCVNPNHLYVGTRQQNGKDARERGIGSFKRNTTNRKWSIQRWITGNIIDLYASGKFRLWEIGAMFGKTESAISRIVNRNRRTTKNTAATRRF